MFKLARYLLSATHPGGRSKATFFASFGFRLQRAARRAGRTPFTLYQIRRSFASGLRRAGTDVADIRDMYGHTRLEATMIYAPPELAKHRATMERLRQSDRTGVAAPSAVPIRLA